MASSEVICNDEEIKKMLKEVRGLIFNSERYDLLLLEGCLSNLNKLWQGKVIRFDLRKAPELQSSVDIEERERKTVAEDKHEKTSKQKHSHSDKNMDTFLKYIVLEMDPITNPEIITSDMIAYQMKFPESQYANICILEQSMQSKDLQSFLDIIHSDKKGYLPFSKGLYTNDKTRPMRIFAITGSDFCEGIEGVYNKETLEMITKCKLAYLPRNKSLPEMTIPDNYEIKEMNFKECLFAIQKYRFSTVRMCHTLTTCAKYGFAIGAFHQGTEYPDSWVFMSDNGAISALNTVPEHRRQGLGRAVVWSLAKKILALDKIPFAFIVNEEASSPSGNLFQSLGFELSSEDAFTMFKFV